MDSLDNSPPSSPAGTAIRATFSTREVANLLGLPEHRVRAYARAGLIGGRHQSERRMADTGCGPIAQAGDPLPLPAATLPVQRSVEDTGEDGHTASLAAKRLGRGPLRFSFRDLSVLRMAERLSKAGLSHGRIERTLRALRHGVPQAQSLAELKVTCEDGRLIASDGQMRWDAESGQYEMLGLGFGEAASDSDSSAKLPTPLPAPRQFPPIPDEDEAFDAERASIMVESVAQLGDEIATAQEWFEAGVALEAVCHQRAYQAYLHTLTADPEHVEAMINIGRLCSAVGDGAKAAAYFRLAVRIDPDLAVAHFNLGVTLHDLGDEHEAIEAYRAALMCDPEFADAHYNLASLLEQFGDSAAARRHMDAYLRYCPSSGEES